MTTALRSYERTLRPFVDEIQATVKPALLRVGLPETKFAISAFQTATALHIPELAARFAREDRGGGWELPVYPGLLEPETSRRA